VDVGGVARAVVVHPRPDLPAAAPARLRWLGYGGSI
jgi:hypothetical protein